MDLKIFRAGFTEQEINDFMNSNIIYKAHFLDNGDVYLMWKAPNEVGRRPIEHIELIDNMIKKSEGAILAHVTDVDKATAEIANLQEKLQKFHKDQDGYKDIQSRIRAEENRIAMSAASIKDETDTITSMNIKVLEITSGKASAGKSKPLGSKKK